MARVSNPESGGPRRLFGREHVERYQATDGAEGHDWVRGAPVLILTTRGRRSAERRHNALIYGRHGDDYLVVASKGGAPTPPHWYLNLSQHPEVGVQVKHEKFRAQARTASPQEKPELWRIMTQIWPDYDNYQQRTDRDIPVVVLQSTSRTLTP